MTREEHIAEFWLSFAETMQKAGGAINWNGIPQMTLLEVADGLAQNGFRFAYKKSETDPRTLISFMEEIEKEGL